MDPVTHMSSFQSQTKNKTIHYKRMPEKRKSNQKKLQKWLELQTMLLSNWMISIRKVMMALKWMSQNWKSWIGINALKNSFHFTSWTLMAISTELRKQCIWNTQIWNHLKSLKCLLNPFKQRLLHMIHGMIYKTIKVLLCNFSMSFALRMAVQKTCLALLSWRDWGSFGAMVVI